MPLSRCWRFRTVRPSPGPFACGTGAPTGPAPVERWSEDPPPPQKSRTSAGLLPAPAAVVTGTLATVPAVGAELLLGQADGLDQVVEPLVLQRGQAQPLADALDHGGVLVRVGVGVLVEVLGRRRPRAP